MLPGDSKARKWLELPATIEQNEITSKLPPKETTIWFLTVQDERKTTVSSRLVFPIDK